MYSVFCYYPISLCMDFDDFFNVILSKPGAEQEENSLKAQAWTHFAVRDL